MATCGRYPSSKERVNYGRLCRIVVDLCTDVMRKILTDLVVPNQLLIVVRNCSDLKTLAADELQRINRAVAGASYGTFDISFLYTLIRAIGTQELRYELDKNIPANSIWTKLQSTPSLMAQLTRKQSIAVQNATDYSGFDCGLLTLIIINLTSINIPNIIPSANKWGGKTLPNCTNIKLGDDIERIRFIRNTVYGHVSDTCVSDSEFRKYGTELTGIMQRMDLEFNTGGQYLKDLNDIETASLDDKWEIYESTIRELVEREQEIKDRLEIQEESTQQLQKDVNKIESRLETQEDSTGQLQEGINQVESRLETQEDSTEQLQEGINQMESRLEKQEDSTGQLQKGVISLDKSIEEMGGRVDVVQTQVISLSLAKVRNLLKHITTARQLRDASKSLYEEIKTEHMFEKADNKLVELKRKGDRWDKNIESAIELETELQGSWQYAAEPLTPDALEKELQRIHPSEDFKYLQYLQDAQKFDHEHNIHQVIDAASKEIKLKKQVQNLLENITTAKQLWDASKEMFEEIKAEHLLEKAENKLRELERKKDRWDKSIETAVKLGKKIQGSRPYDADPFTSDTLEKELQRVKPSTDFKYLQYLQDAQKPEHEHNIHRIINAASKEIGLKKEEISPGKLEHWIQSENTYYPTKATATIGEEIKTQKKVVASGLAGSGKTAAIHHTALKLKEEGYRLCCVETFNDIKIKMDRFGKKEKQVYVIDDVFGVHGVDEVKRKQWCDDNKDEVERCFNNPNISILCSSRMQVLNDTQLNTIKSRFTVVNISEGAIGLSKDEQEGIFRKHAITKQRNTLLTENKDQLKDDIKEKVREVECPVGCFPLVCHLYTGEEEPKQTIEEYFNKPLKVIADHLEKLKVEDPLSHLCLLLCLIYDNKLPVSIITVGDESEETRKQRMELLELCELDKSTSREKIRKKMDTLLQTFVKREGDTYQFVHDIIHDAVIQHVTSLSSSFYQFIIRYCSPEFFRRRVHLSGVVCKDRWGDGHDTESCINIRHDSFPCWGIRVLDIVRDGVRTSDQLYNDIDEGRCSEDDDRTWWDNPWKDVFKYNRCVHSTEGQDAIARALDRKSSDLQTIMCTKGYSLYSGDPRVTGLHCAMKEGLTHIVTKTLSMLSQTQLQELDSIGGEDLLCWAIDKCGTDVIQALIVGGVDVNTPGVYGRTPLHKSLRRGDNETTQLLLDNGADVNQCNKDGLSVLYASVWRGDNETTQLLLDNGADVNQCKKNGRSVLYLSQIREHDAMTELLQSRGAVCMYKSKQYNHVTDIPDSLIDCARCNNYQAVKTLIERGADVNQCDEDGESVLYKSVSSLDPIYTKFLVNKGADGNQCDKDGEPVLYTPVSSLHPVYKITKLLLVNGADVNKCGKKGTSALYKSQLLEEDTITELLQSHGAVCMYKGKQYTTITDTPRYEMKRDRIRRLREMD